VINAEHEQRRHQNDASVKSMGAYSTIASASISTACQAISNADLDMEVAGRISQRTRHGRSNVRPLIDIDTNIRVRTTSFRERRTFNAVSMFDRLNRLGVRIAGPDDLTFSFVAVVPNVNDIFHSHRS